MLQAGQRRGLRMGEERRVESPVGVDLDVVGMVVGEQDRDVALHHLDVHSAQNLIRVRRQIDLDMGEVTWPKDGDGRWVMMSPRFRAHLETMPRRGKTIDREKGEIMFPAVRGGYMPRSTWSTHWQSVRASAGMPGQEFYELKHRAIQWMVDHAEDGGLGLDPATVAEMVGHDDGGYLIATVYIKLARRRALARAQRAMDDYGERHYTLARPPPSSPRKRAAIRRLGPRRHAPVAPSCPTRSMVAARSLNGTGSACLHTQAMLTLL